MAPIGGELPSANQVRGQSAEEPCFCRPAECRCERAGSPPLGETNFKKCDCVHDTICICEHVAASRLLTLSIYQQSQFLQLQHFKVNLMSATDGQARNWLARKQLVAWAANNQILQEHEGLQVRFSEGMHKNKSILSKFAETQAQHSLQVQASEV